MTAAGLIVIVVNGEVARQAEMPRFAAQKARAEGMKCRDPHIGGALAARAQKIVDAFLHHVGGLVGKRDGENGAWWNAPLEQMGDAIGDDARLAGSRAGQDEQRSFGCEYGFALALVELVEKRCCLRKIWARRNSS